MSEELRAVLALVLAGGLALLTVPAARRIAFATGFLDHPVDYKQHGRATPYLGGAGVIAAFLVSASIVGEAWAEIPSVIALALLLAAVGTIDDRRLLGPGLRFGLQLAAGFVLWTQGINWEIASSDLINLPVSMIWVAGLCNAFNLLDNIDGATGTTAAVSAAGIGAIAIDNGAAEVGAVAFALSGACAAFLVFNLAQPAKIFLGDGGSLPIGFLIAALSMALPLGLSSESILVAVPIAGIAIFDTSLVALSRTRRGVSVLTGGRDHMTHRLLGWLGTPHRVALALALAQGALCALAFTLDDLTPIAIDLVAIGYVLFAAAMLALFESPALRQPVPLRDPVEQSA